MAMSMSQAQCEIPRTLEVSVPGLEAIGFRALLSSSASSSGGRSSKSAGTESAVASRQWGDGRNEKLPFPAYRRQGSGQQVGQVGKRKGERPTASGLHFRASPPLPP